MSAQGLTPLGSGWYYAPACKALSRELENLARKGPDQRTAQLLKQFRAVVKPRPEPAI